jgi:hypothetical protein
VSLDADWTLGGNLLSDCIAPKKNAIFDQIYTVDTKSVVKLQLVF